MGSLSRRESLQRLRDGAWDVVVIGGGATGLGAAVDAAARGYRTPAARGARLRQGDVEPEHEARPRRRPLPGAGEHLAGARGAHGAGAAPPECAAPGPRRGFVVPSLRWWESPFYGLGLKVYDGWRASYRLGRSRWIARAEVRRAAADDPSPRACAAASSTTTASSTTPGWPSPSPGPPPTSGAPLLNYARVTGLTQATARATSTASSPRRRDRRGVRVAAQVVINATGVFADAVRRLDEPAAGRR